MSKGAPFWYICLMEKKSFDSYVRGDKLIIITTDYVGDEREVTENIISLERGQEIVTQLQLNIEEIKYNQQW